MFHRFFLVLCQGLSICIFAFLHFHSGVRHNDKVCNLATSLFLMTITRSRRLAEIRWSVCISKSQRSLLMQLLAAVISLSLFLESLYWCIYAMLSLSSPIPPSFLDIYSLSMSSFGIKVFGFKALSIVINFFFPLVHLSDFLSGPFSKYLTMQLPMYLSFWWDFCIRAWFREAFSFVWGINFFLSYLLVWWYPLSIFSYTYNFPSLQAFWLFSDSVVLFTFYCFSFPTFHYQHGTFFNAKFHSYILAVYSYY